MAGPNFDKLEVPLKTRLDNMMFIDVHASSLRKDGGNRISSGPAVQ